MKMALFVGRLSQDTRTKDLEDFFGKFGKLHRCDVKGSYGFVTFDSERDAEDAMKELNGKELCGSKIAVEWAKGSGHYDGNRGGRGGGGRDSRRRSPSKDDKCFICQERGHWARDCPDRRSSRRRSRSRSRSRRSRTRSRSRSRSRSRDRKRDRRSRSRSRGSRSRSRERDSKKQRRSRSRSVEKKRSRSRSRSRSKERDEKKDRSPSPKKDATSPKDDKE